MRLKRLELYGYKSFATRCAFEFGEGITAIVGPNGSGKSNVADAMRWVMGEQSFSSLRAKSTEDMIFSGSRSRARLGMAEVLITLDNSEGWLPLDYTEVTVGRRAYRSGENEYLLNGNRVRYRDVLEVLGGAGLMRSNYTVVGQGLVDAVLSLRPEARRTLFEEAAGIAPHLRKRADALKRIEETEHNLERVNDLLNELRPTAANLRRQAERAEEHLLLAQDLKELQRIWYGYHWQRRQRQLARTEGELQEQEVRLESQRTYAHALQGQIEESAKRCALQQQASDLLVAEQASLRSAAESVRRDLAVASERQRLYQQQYAALEGEVRALTSRRDILQLEIERAAQELTEQEAVYASCQTELEVTRRQLAELNVARRAIEQQMSAARNRLTQRVAVVADGRARLEQWGERRATLSALREEALAALATLSERRRALQVQGQALVAREQALAQTQAELQRSQSRDEDEANAVREQMAAMESKVAQARAERERLVARRELLTRMRQELTGYYPGVRDVLSTEAGLHGLLGTVASLMDVPKEFEQAIEAALGQRLQNVVAETWGDAEAAIGHLKRTRAGWATFLPLDSLRVRPALSWRAESGVLGVASALVHYEERLRVVYELLLGSVIVVQDLAIARRLLEQRSGASLYVTLGGETVQPSGALSGGARRETTNLLAQEREWRDLPGHIGAAEQALVDTLRNQVALQTALGDVQRGLKERERRLMALRLEYDGARNATSSHGHDVHELEREQQWREKRLAQAAAEVSELVGREQQLREKLASAQQNEASATAELRELGERLAAAGGEDLRRSFAELETRVAVAERTIRSQRTLLASHRTNLEQLARQISDKEAQNSRLGEEMRLLAETSAATRARLVDCDGQIADIRQRLDPARDELERLERERRDLERSRLQSQERLNEVELEYSRATLERDRLKDEQAALSREIESDLGPIDLPGTLSYQLRLDLGDDIIELPSVESLPTGLGDEIRELKTRLRRLGVINPNAPQDYEQLLERQTFLQGQIADLRGTIAALHEIIHELDTVIERDFVATVGNVDRTFRDCFSKLFGGGTARLVLVDPDNVGISGLEIIAHPPGKRAQNLSLLSGGERALTAAALLFALLQANPVPFCFLDEVDAALDEANVGRFRELLLEYARATQFILITHNRHTVEVASTIYGISMGEQGVSQCLSLKLDDARALSDLSA
jgi:chromosome segregation protein